jgi:serine O-acetyltransferase
MEINKWMNDFLPDIVERLRNSIDNGYHVRAGENMGVSGRNEIYEVLESLLSVLFPGSYSRDQVPAKELNFYLDDTLRHVSFRLLRHLKGAFENSYIEEDCLDCEERARASLFHLMESIPDIRNTLLGDIEAAYNGDPAASSFDEIVLSYPGIEAIATHRIAHNLYEQRVPIIPRIMTEHAHSRTGIDIHPGAKIGTHFFIDHGTGVVIGETTEIGSNVKIYQGVTLGAKSPFERDGTARRGQKRHPTIEDDVIIYANATILGGTTVIGKGAIIGGNTWITSSVDPGTVVYRS